MRYCQMSIETFLPSQSLEPLRDQIGKHHNCEKSYGGDYNLCLGYIIHDASFICNTRDLIDSYAEKTYAIYDGFSNDKLAYL
ncbi:hypothetical protein QWA68_015892 [Fusarium oxysporum]|nr:hypothetical protein QWA68_015892 [Fusarium oxysporum]